MFMLRRSAISKIYRVGRNTALPLLNDCRPDSRYVNNFLGGSDDFLVLSFIAATGYRASSFPRRVESWILLILPLNLAYLFLLSSDLGREINFSEVSCPKSLPRHLPNVPRKKSGSKTAGEVVFLKKKLFVFSFPI